VEKKQRTDTKKGMGPGGGGAGRYTPPVHATGDLDRQTDSETAPWFLRGSEGITGSGVERTVEWSGVGAAQEPEYRGDGDAHAHLIEYRKEEKKREKALVPSLYPSSFGFTYALFFYRGDRC